jgi:hypothetical protein
MATLIKAALIASAKKILLAFLSEKVLTKLILDILEEGAKRTDWTIDDRIVAEIRDEFPKID